MLTRILILVPAVAICLLLSGCQTISTMGSMLGLNDAGDRQRTLMPGHQQIIAENLVDTLTQLPETQPLQTTIQMSAPDTPFGEVLIETLSSAGYGQQIVEGDIGQNVLRYLVENAETETGYRTRYKVEIGEIGVERDYRLV